MDSLHKTLLSLVLTSMTMGGCDSNVFQTLDSSVDPAEQAAAYLDQGKADEAISTLNNALQGDSENWQLISLLASAKAQKAGIDTLDIALKLATDEEEESEGESNGITAMFVVLPAVTNENRALMLEAVNLLSSIPEESRTNADNFKSTIFNTAFTALQAKFFDDDGDGAFTVDELANLDDASAEAILDSLLNAETAAAYYQGEGESDASAASKVSDIRAQIDAQPGESTAEKLRSFLGNGS